MKQLNTIPIEDFLNKTRIAIKSGQKTVVLTVKEATDLQNSLSLVMTRLAGDLDQTIAEVKSNSNNDLEVRMDGGKF